MLHLNNLFSTILSIKPTRIHLPRLRSLGSRFLNALVILALVLPNMTIAVQAAVPEQAVNLPREDSVSLESIEAALNKENSDNYQSPVFTHPQPRKKADQYVLQKNEMANTATEPAISVIPLLFVENVGQFHEQALYQVREGNSISSFSSDSISVTRLVPIRNDDLRNGELSLDLHSEAPPDQIQSNAYAQQESVNIRFSFVGANPNPAVKGIKSLDTKVSYLLGKNAKDWAAGVPAWAGVRYENLYPGVDLVITSQNGHWIWQILAEAKASLSQVRLRVEGADQLQLVNDQILLTTTAGDFTFPLLQLAGELTSESVSRTTISGNTVLSPFYVPSETAKAQANQSGTAELLFSTFAGGPDGDHGWDIITDDIGASYVTGYTSSLFFAIDPPAPGVYPFSAGGWDAFVAKLNPQGSAFEYFTFLGGSENDYGYAIDLSGGEAIVSGRTVSTDFPVTPGAFQETNSGAADTFVAKLNSTGTGLIFSTYLGGSGNDWVEDMVIDQDTGDILLVGSTESPDFPMADPADYAGSFDPFVAAIDPTGGLVSSFYHGSSGYDIGKAIDQDSCGRIVIAGYTNSPEFPMVNVWPSWGDQEVYGGGAFDGFYAIFGTGPKSAYFGGDGLDFVLDLVVGIVDVYQTEGIYLVGQTESTDLPFSENGFQDSLAGGVGDTDAFIAKKWGYPVVGTDHPAFGLCVGTGIFSSTYLGGSGEDRARGVDWLAPGVVYISGLTESVDDFPTELAYQADFGGGSRDAFLSVIDLEQNQLNYSSYIGGSGSEWGEDVTIDGSGNAFITGNTESADFPTTPGAAQEGHSGNKDAFVVKTSIPDRYVISEESVFSSCGMLKGVMDIRECSFTIPAGDQGYTADPINTRTGGFDLPVDDISIQTSAGPLVFQRTYSSRTTEIYTDDLGFGWTHNHDSRLIFAGDPGGQTGFVLFKAHSANQYKFIDHGDGTYSPMPGVIGELVFDDGIYGVTDGQQNTYSFDEYGTLLSWADPQWHAFYYSYDANEDLIQISADGGLRYLTIIRDPQERIQSVSDNTGRSVGFGYDLNGDLISKLDVLGNLWIYTYDDPSNPHYLTEVIDPRGITESLTEYDLQGRAVRQYDGENNLLAEITYNADGTSEFVDALGNTSTHAYDDRKTLTEEMDPLAASTNTTYDNQFSPSYPRVVWLLFASSTIVRLAPSVLQFKVVVFPPGSVIVAGRNCSS